VYGIPISKASNVTVKQMLDTAATINSAMDSSVFINKDILTEKITEIHIVSGSSATYNSTSKILTVGYDAEYNTIGLTLYNDVYNVL